MKSKCQDRARQTKGSYISSKSKRLDLKLAIKKMK